jgi:hypothetical protein
MRPASFVLKSPDVKAHHFHSIAHMGGIMNFSFPIISRDGDSPIAFVINRDHRGARKMPVRKSAKGHRTHIETRGTFEAVNFSGLFLPSVLQLLDKLFRQLQRKSPVIFCERQVHLPSLTTDLIKAEFTMPIQMTVTILFLG